MGLFDRLRGDDDPRVAFVGVDGVPYSLLSENRERFPNFAALADEGSAGEISSIVPPESSACWPALTTGVNPGGTGVYGFQDREIDSYETYVPMGRDVQATRLWECVHDADRNATVMNVPVTFPPERGVQRMVSGFLSPGVEEAAYPDDLREYLERIDYRLDVTVTPSQDEDKSAFVADARETLAKRHEAFMHYIDKDDWDLFFGVYMTPDRINHFLFEDYERDGPFRDEFLEFYRTLDSYIGEIREALPEDVTLVVASDHGFTTLAYEFDCNAWLKDAGWLSFRSDGDELSDITDESRAYSLIPGRFYLNCEGREPRGCVTEEAFAETRRELKAELKAIEGPEGNRVIDRVITREEAFRGDHTAIAPDLVAIANDGFDLKAGFPGNSIFSKGPRTGMHTFADAALFVDDERARIEDADLYDIAPTILSLLDIEYDRASFDGASVVKG